MSRSDDAPLSADYDAEDADITLVSDEGTMFKVHSYMLKANSALFRDMLSDKPDAPPTLHTSTSRSNNNSINSMESWSQAKAVLLLCDKYDCPFLVERVCIRLRYLAAEAPWEIFVLASQYDQVQLAETALEHLHTDEKRRSYNSGNIPMREAQRIALPYLFGLLDQLNANPLASAATGTVDYARYSPAYVQQVWKGLARAFKPRE
ncbi:hypothetical protein IAU59_005455 [Kwoniella sp. CBS 9459]